MCQNLVRFSLQAPSWPIASRHAEIEELFAMNRHESAFGVDWLQGTQPLSPSSARYSWDRFCFAALVITTEHNNHIGRNFVRIITLISA